jgi:hypothetical protein
MVIKYDKPNEARYVIYVLFCEFLDFRALLERVTNIGLNSHKTRLFLKRWLDLEQQIGNDETIAQVRQRADIYVKKID